MFIDPLFKKILKSVQFIIGSNKMNKKNCIMDKNLMLIQISPNSAKLNIINWV